MTNRFDWGAFKRPEGWIAFYRMVHHSKNFILREGKHDIIFATADEAEKAAGLAFKEYLNSPINGLTAPDRGAWDEANSAFNLEPTKRPSIIRQRGKSRPVIVERRQA